MATAPCPAGRMRGPGAGPIPAQPPRRTQCYLRLGLVGIAAAAHDIPLHCLACAWSKHTPECVIAVQLAQGHASQHTVGSAGQDVDPVVSPAQEHAARTYVRRIPSVPQQGYAEEYLLWCLAGRPAGCEPRLGCYGLSLAAGEHLAGTVELLLSLPPAKPRGRRRRR